MGTPPAHSVANLLSSDRNLLLAELQSHRKPEQRDTTAWPISFLKHHDKHTESLLRASPSNRDSLSLQSHRSQRSSEPVNSHSPTMQLLRSSHIQTDNHRDLKQFREIRDHSNWAQRYYDQICKCNGLRRRVHTVRYSANPYDPRFFVSQLNNNSDQRGDFQRHRDPHRILQRLYVRNLDQFPAAFSIPC